MKDYIVTVLPGFVATFPVYFGALALGVHSGVAIGLSLATTFAVCTFARKRLA